MSAWLRIPLRLATAGLLGLVMLTALLTGGYFYVEPSVPEADELAHLPVQIPLTVYSRDSRLMQYFGDQKSAPIQNYDEFPEVVIEAFLAAEDDRFFEHSGIDYEGILRGLWYLVTRPGERVPGGSTLTQQVARNNNLLTRDYSFVRKFKEWILAFRIEREFTKKEILRLYLNTAFFGQHAKGIAAAAQIYFDKSLDELTLGEVAILAGIPQGPSIMNPYNGPERAAERRRYVLRRMRELGEITEAQRQAALAEPIVPRIYGFETQLEADYVAQMAYEWCLDRLDKPTCDSGGLKITTTVDSRLQRAGNRALRDALEDYDHRHGYRGPIGHVDLEALGLGAAGVDDGEMAALDTVLDEYTARLGALPAVVLAVDDVSADVYMARRGSVSIGFDQLSWAAPYLADDSTGSAPRVAGDVLHPGDIVRFKLDENGLLVLAQVPGENDIQGAFVSLDPKDGAVVALAGGYDFGTTKYNRVTQARRQPGSSFKPFFYLSALDRGYTLASILTDSPRSVYEPSLERTRFVENYEREYHGDVRLRYALAHSLNAAADRLIVNIGASYVGNYVERFGFDPTVDERNASLALGSLAVTPLELASAYTVLANGGYAVGIRPDATDPRSHPEPYFIQRVEDSEGHVLYDAARSVEYVCPENEVVPDAVRDAVPYPVPGAAASAPPARTAPLATAADADGDEPTLIEEQSDLYPPERCAERVESPQIVYLITDVLKDVVRETSGVRAGRAFPERKDLAGKTGTTNGPRDAWFAGFNADILAVAWVGFNDDSRELGKGEQGGRTAIPAWIDFMKVALDGQPEHALPRPPGIIERQINPKTGLVVADCDRDYMRELFLIENQPNRESDSACYRNGSQGGPRGGSSQGPGEGETLGPGSSRIFP